VKIQPHIITDSFHSAFELGRYSRRREN
jgi:hypothetical protein